MRKYQEIVEKQGGPRLVSPVESAQEELDKIARKDETQAGASLREQQIRQEEAAADEMENLFEEQAGLNLRGCYGRKFRRSTNKNW